MSVIIKAKRKRPADDVLSGLAAYKDKKLGRMGKYDLIATAVLLLIAGHETTVNLIANGMLTVLRHRDWLERLRQDPALAPRIVEELLRFEPPVHFRTRKTLAEIPIAGTVIPKGAPLILLFASGNRDPKRFPDPDRFDPIALTIYTLALAVARIIALARPWPDSKSRHRSLRSPKDSSIRSWRLTRLLIAPVLRCADPRVSR